MDVDRGDREEVGEDEDEGRPVMRVARLVVLSPALMKMLLPSVEANNAAAEDESKWDDGDAEAADADAGAAAEVAGAGSSL
jgi:hypothetical protein